MIRCASRVFAIFSVFLIVGIVLAAWSTATSQQGPLRTCPTAAVQGRPRQASRVHSSRSRDSSPGCRCGSPGGCSILISQTYTGLISLASRPPRVFVRGAPIRVHVSARLFGCRWASRAASRACRRRQKPWGICGEPGLSHRLELVVCRRTSLARLSNKWASSASAVAEMSRAR